MTLTTATPTRCLIDDRPPGRPVDTPGSRVCRDHRQRLGEMLDPQQAGQMFTAPGERRTPASIPVLWRLLDAQPGSGTEHVTGGGGVFGPRPPGRVDVMALRDLRTRPAERDELWSVLGVLVAIAQRLDLRDIHGHPVPLPRLDPPPPPPVCLSAYGQVIGLSGALLWQRYRPRPIAPHRPVQDLCAWLLARIDALCSAAWIDDAWHDLAQLHRQLRDAAGDPAPRPLGPCRKLVDTNGRPWKYEPTVGLRADGPYECGVPLYLPPQGLKGMDEPVHLPTAIRCGACGGVYSRVEIERYRLERKVEMPA